MRGSWDIDVLFLLRWRKHAKHHQTKEKDHLNMTEKEKADCIIELHKAHLDHFKQTRDIEFKVDIALWTLIAASGSFLYKRIELNNVLSLLIYSTVSVGIVL